MDVVPILYYDIQYLTGCYSINTTISDNGNRIDNNCDHELVHYGVVYSYVHAYYIVQLLLYNIQRSIGCNNSNSTNCDDNNSRHTAGLSSLSIVMEQKIDNTNLQSSRSVIMIIIIVKNNQVQVCDDVLHTLVDDIHSTAGDVDYIDYESFHITLKSNYHDRDDVCESVFDTKHKTACDNNQRTT